MFIQSGSKQAGFLLAVVLMVSMMVGVTLMEIERLTLLHRTLVYQMDRKK